MASADVAETGSSGMRAPKAGRAAHMGWGWIVGGNRAGVSELRRYEA